MNSFIMIGMPGSGKSTLGRILAENIGYKYVDTDNLIMNHYNKPLKKLIEELGVEGFIKAEGEILSQVNADKTVIATGGSAVYSRNGMEHLKTLGKVIYLCYSLEDIESRVGNLIARGVVCRNCRTLRELFEQRRPYYEEYADITVHLEHASVGRSISRLIKAVTPYVSDTLE
ncbi:MAG: shikimate kinase [Ruminococcus sp.]